MRYAIHAAIAGKMSPIHKTLCHAMTAITLLASLLPSLASAVPLAAARPGGFPGVPYEITVFHHDSRTQDVYEIPTTATTDVDDVIVTGDWELTLEDLLDEVTVIDDDTVTIGDDPPSNALRQPSPTTVDTNPLCPGRRAARAPSRIPRDDGEPDPLLVFGGLMAPHVESAVVPDPAAA